MDGANLLIAGTFDGTDNDSFLLEFTAASVNAFDKP